MKQHRIRGLCLLLCCVLLSCTAVGCEPPRWPFAAKKPVIYLYPPEEMAVTVSLEFAGELTCTYPAAPEGVWRVTAHPDGILTDPETGGEYGCLFWEGSFQAEMDFTEGFVVKGADTAAFLEEKLTLLGLNARERTDFITYWLPQMQDNPYNLIAFQGEAYEELAKLTIDPQPDSLLRVFMAYRPLEHPVDLPEQELELFTRSGFTAVEWGGTEIRG